MNKLTTRLELSIVIEPKGGLKFGQSFVDKVKAAAIAQASNTKFEIISSENTEETIRIGIKVPDGQSSTVGAFIDGLNQALDVLSQTGADSDLFAQLLERHPELTEKQREVLVSRWNGMLSDVDEAAPIDKEIRSQIRELALLGQVHRPDIKVMKPSTPIDGNVFAETKRQ